MADTAWTALLQVPYFAPAIAGGLTVVMFSILTLGVYLAIVLAVPVYRKSTMPPDSDAAVSDPSGGGGGTAVTTLVVVQAYVPFAGTFNILWSIPLDALDTLVSSLRNLDPSIFLALLVAVLLFAAWIALWEFVDVILATWFKFRTCTLRDIVYGLLRYVNVARFLGALFIQGGWNFFWGIGWLLSFLVFRVALECAITNAQQVADGLALQIVAVLKAFFNSIIDFFVTQPDPLTAHWNLVPFFAAFGDVFPVLGLILDCGCSYLSFIWTDFLQLFTLASLHVGLEAVANTPVRFLQAVFTAIRDHESIVNDGWTSEAQTAVLQLGDWVGAVSVFVINTLINLLNLIPVTPLSVRAATMSTSALLTSVDVVMQARQVRPDAALIMRARSDFNLSSFIGLHYLLAIVEAPWPRIFTEPAAGVLALVNNTLNLPLLATRKCDCFADIAYLQVGYIFDRVNNGGFALGDTLAVFSDHVPPIIGDLVAYVATAVRIAIELLIDAVFYNVYLPDPGGNFLKFTAPYCKAPTEAPQINYRVVYNATAELAQLVGCDPLTDPYPLDSASATCSASVAGCFALSVPRLVHELVTLALQFLCYVSELVQFDGTQTTFNELDGTKLWLAYQHLADCLRRLFYLFNVYALPDPTDTECEYVLPGNVIAYKRQIACTTGNLIQAALLAAGSFVYQILRLLRTLLTSVVVPDLGVRAVVPTFKETVDNLIVILCDVGAFLGSLLPFDLSCSAQTLPGVFVGGGSYRPLFTTVQDIVPPPVVPMAQRQPVGTFCTYTRAEWAAPPAIPCNCSNASITGAWNNTVSPPPLVPPECFLECVVPRLIDSNFYGRINIGSSIDKTFEGLTSMQILFTDPDAVRAFLGDANLTRFNFAEVSLLNPVNGTDQPAGDFVAELLTALLNNWYQRVFSPAVEPVFVSGAAPICSATFAQHGADTPWANYTAANYDNFITLVQPYVYGNTIFNLLDLLNRVLYGYAPLGGNYAFLFFLSNIYVGGPTPTATPMYQLAQAIRANFAWGTPEGIAAGRSWNMTMDVMLQVLRIYNNAAPQCNPLAAPSGENTCFSLVRVPQPAEPVNETDPTFALNVTGRRANDTIRNNMPDAWAALPMGPCNCNAPGTLQALYDAYQRGDATNTYVPCLLECYGPAFPLTMGQRKDQCYSAGYCDFHVAQEITNTPTLQALMTFFSPAIGAFYRFDNVDNVVGLTDKVLRAHFMAAHLNWHMSRRLFPTKYLFVRYLTDPAFDTAQCFRVSDPTFLEAIAGQRVDMVVEVLETLFFLSASAAPAVATPTCSTLFAASSRQYGICAGLARNLDTTKPSDSYLALLMSSFLVQYNTYWSGAFPPSFSFNGGTFIDSKHCFVVAASAGVLALPDSDLAWVSPQFGALPAATVGNIKPVGSIAAGTEGFTCALGQVVGSVLYIVVDILHQLDRTVATGGGDWSYGTDFFNSLGRFLILVTSDLAGALLYALTAADCLVCAINGNQPGLDACSDNYLNTFQPILVTLNDILAAIINLAVSTVHFILFFFYYLLSGKFDTLGNLIVSYLTTIFYNFIVPIGKAIISFFLQVLGLCGWVKVITPNVSCPKTTSSAGLKNSEHLKRRKRATAHALAGTAWDYFPDEQYAVPNTTATDRRLWLYEHFAPDWPASVSVPATALWPDPADPCAPRMAALAPRAPDALTEDEADEVAYCLGQALIFEPTRRASYYYLATPAAMTLDTCTRPMLALKASHVAWLAMPLGDRKLAHDCLAARATVVGGKRAAAGRMDAVSDDLFAGGLTGLVTHVTPLLYDWSLASDAAQHRARDGLYAPSVRTSADYLAALDLYYGTARAQLALAEPSTTTVDDYVSALVQADAAASGLKKRTTTAAAATDDVTTARTARLATLARVLEGMHASEYAGLGTTLYAHMAPMLDTAAPPEYAYRADARSTTAWSTSSDPTPDLDTPTTDAALAVYTRRRMDSMMTSTWRVFRGTLGLNVVTNTSGNATAVQKRGLVTRVVTGTNVASAFSQIGRAATRAVGDVLSGRAHRRVALLADAMSTSSTMLSASVLDAAKAITPVAWVPTRTVHARRLYPRTANVDATRAQQVAAAAAAARAPILTLADSMRARWASLSDLHTMMTRVASSSTTGDDRGARINEVLSAMQRAWRTSIAPTMRASVNATECLSGSQTLCEQCLVLDNGIGYAIRIGSQPYDFYLNTPTALPFNTFNGLYADFLAIDAYLQNITTLPVIVGNSSDNPVRFPALNRSVWFYTDDALPNKTGFSDIQPLVNDTVALVGQFWSIGLDGFLRDLLALVGASSTLPSDGANATTTTTMTPLQQRMVALFQYFNTSHAIAPTTADARAAEDDMHARAVEAWKASGRTQARPLPPRLTTTRLLRVVFVDTIGAVSSLVMPFVRPVVQAMGQLAATSRRSQALGAANVVLDAAALALRWLAFLWNWLIACDWGSDLNGTVLRMSLFEAILLVGAVLLVGALLGTLVPALSFLSITFSPSGMLLMMAALSFILSLHASWSALCFPALPSVLLSYDAMYVLTRQLFVAAPILGAGLINEPTYTNDRAGQCSRWEAGEFTVANPKDKGWTGIFDVPLFFFSQLLPEWLAFLRDPNNFSPYFSWLVASPSWQELLGRWDGVNINANEIVYSQQWTSAFVRLIMDLLLISAVVKLLQVSPVASALRFILASAFALIPLAGAAMVAGIMAIFYFTALPNRLVNITAAHARAALRRKDEWEQEAAAAAGKASKLDARGSKTTPTAPAASAAPALTGIITQY